MIQVERNRLAESVYLYYSGVVKICSLTFARVQRPKLETTCKHKTAIANFKYIILREPTRIE